MPAAKKEIKSTKKKKKVKAFPIAGIGASAGGLEAIGSFFGLMPDDFPEMAFVVVSHLDPSHSSILPELLQKYTQMAVHPVSNGMKVQPGRVYVIPPDRDLQLDNGKLRLTQFHPHPGPRAPINYLFRSLAEQQAEMAIGIILSGMGSDDTIGIQSIKGGAWNDDGSGTGQCQKSCNPCHAMEVFAAGEIKQLEDRNPIDGKIRDIRMFPMLDDKGKVVAVIEHLRDITEPKQSAAALRESEEKYPQLFENESDAVMIFDAETLRLEDANRATLDLYGYAKEEFLTITVADVSAEKEKTQLAVKKGEKRGVRR